MNRSQRRHLAAVPQPAQPETQTVSVSPTQAAIIELAGMLGWCAVRREPDGIVGGTQAAWVQFVTDAETPQRDLVGALGFLAQSIYQQLPAPVVVPKLWTPGIR